KLPRIVRQLRAIAARDVEQIGIFPWVPDVFEALRSRGISIAIVSSNTKPNIRRVLGAELASMIVQFGTGAPLFGKAAKINGVIKRCSSSTELTTSIGDEVRDIEAAHALGIRSVAVTWGYGPRRRWKPLDRHGWCMRRPSCWIGSAKRLESVVARNRARKHFH